jgi:phosphoribosyl 1,2-cyclic phosphate phosphodiesterase
MRLQILGTAAAEGWPAIFCGCEACQRARVLGGKNIRTRASLQIDDNYKIDLPPDTHHHSIAYGLELSKLRCLFFTHSHGDHFALQEIEYTKEGFSHCRAVDPIEVYGNEKVAAAVDDLRQRRDLPLTVNVVRPFEPVKVDHLTFIPIPAVHAQSETCLNYVVQSDAHTMLYASDTGPYPAKTLNRLTSFEFNLLVIECTFGPARQEPHTGHLALEGLLGIRDHLAKCGALRPGARTIATHFSHNMGVLHHEMQNIAGREGVEIAYDGMEIVIT